jgi:hypothetical protein
MSTNRSTPLKLSYAVLALAMALTLELSSPGAVSASIAAYPIEHGAVDLLRSHGDAGRLVALEGGDRMLLADTKSACKIKAPPRLPKVKASPGLSKTKAAPGVSKAKATQTRGGQVVGKKGDDPPEPPEPGDDHGRRRRRGGDKTPTVQANEQGFIGHQLDFVSPGRRGPAEKKPKDSEESNKDGDEDSGSVPQGQRP